MCVCVWRGKEYDKTITLMVHMIPLNIVIMSSRRIAEDSYSTCPLNVLSQEVHVSWVSPLPPCNALCMTK